MSFQVLILSLSSSPTWIWKSSPFIAIRNKAACLDRQGGLSWRCFLLRFTDCVGAETLPLRGKAFLVSLRVWDGDGGHVQEGTHKRSSIKRSAWVGRAMGWWSIPGLARIGESLLSLVQEADRGGASWIWCVLQLQTGVTSVESWPRREGAASANCSVVGSRAPWPSPPPSSLLLVFPTGQTQPGARGKVNLADAVMSLGVLGHRAEWWGAERGSGEHTGSTQHTASPPPQRFGFTQTRQSWGDGDPATPGALRVLPIKLFDITRDFKREVSTGTNGSHPDVGPWIERTEIPLWILWHSGLKELCCGDPLSLTKHTGECSHFTGWWGSLGGGLSCRLRGLEMPSVQGQGSAWSWCVQVRQCMTSRSRMWTLVRAPEKLRLA